MRYDYECTNPECDNFFEAVQSIKDDALVHCEQCGQDTLKRVLYPFDFSVHNITTLGQQAIHNTRKMGKYELQEKRQEIKDNKQKARKAAREELGAKLGVTIPDTPKYEAPWRPGTSEPDMSLAKLTPQQKERYILTGKK